ncbi:MAG TPA: hypothetical protein VG276_31615 [Actinomycetes bacterium]|nr:hypothetical protein [Actinomycetes bacterium]
MGRVEFAEGALVRLRAPVRVNAEAGRDVLTDLDVVAVDIDLRLRVSRSILECKSGQGQAGEPDRLLWLAGLRQYVEADRAVLVRQTVSRRGRDVAKRLDIQVFDVPTLEKREAAHAWLPPTFAHLSGSGCMNAESRTDIQLRGLGNIPADLVAFLRYEALLAAPHRVLLTLTNLREALDTAGILPDPTGKIIAGHALVGLLVAAVTDAQALDALPPQRLQQRLELALTVGNPEDTSILEVLAAADELLGHLVEQVHARYVERGAIRLDVSVPNLRELIADPPPWIPRYLDLLDALRANPAVARDLPQTAELACFDALVGDTNYESRAFDHLFTAEHRQLLRLAVQMLRDVAGPLLVGRLNGLANINFDRVAPALPERRGTAPTHPSEPPELAREPDDANN